MGEPTLAEKKALLREYDSGSSFNTAQRAHLAEMTAYAALRREIEREEAEERERARAKLPTLKEIAIHLEYFLGREPSRFVSAASNIVARLRGQFHVSAHPFVDELLDGIARLDP